MADQGIIRRVIAIFDRASAKRTEQQLAQSLGDAGKKGGDNFLRELRAAFGKRMTDLRVQLAKGIINPAEFRKQSDLAAREFNTGLVKGMEEARKQGKLTEAEYAKLGRQFKRTGDEGAGAFGRLTGAIKSAGQALLLAFGGRAVLRWIDGSVEKFADFDLAMTRSLAIMGDVDDVMRNRMAAAAREVSEQFNFAAADVAKAFFYLASAGLNAEQSLAALPKVAAFAKAGAFDLATATDLLTDAQSALGLTIRDDVVKNMLNMARVSDVLTQANNLSNATIEQFSESLTNKAGAALRLVNKDVEEGVAVLAAYADQGVKGSEAGERLNITLRELQRASRENRKEFDRLGIQVFDGNGELRNMADIIAELERALGPMSTELKGATLSQLGFTEKSIDGLKALLGYSDAIRKYEAELRAAAGTTQSVADKQMQAFAEQWGQIKQQMANARAELGKAIIDALNLGKNLPKITSLIRAFGDHARDLVGLVISLGKAIAIVAGARGLLALRAGFLAAEGGMAFFTAGIKRLWVAIGPTGWAIIGLTTLIELFRRTGDEAKAAAQKAADAVADLRASVQGLEDSALTSQIGALDAERKTVQQKVDALQDTIDKMPAALRAVDLLTGGGFQESLETAREELGGIVDQMILIRREQSHRKHAPASPATAPDGTDTGTPTGTGGAGGTDKQVKAFAERKSAIEQEIADLKRLHDAQAAGIDVEASVNRSLEREAELRKALEDLTPAQAAEISKLVGLRNQERDAIDAAAQAERDRQADEATYRRLLDQDRAEAARQQGVLDGMRRAADQEQRQRSAEREGADAVRALNRELFIQEAVLRAGAVAGSAFAEQVSTLAGQQWDAANSFASPWLSALDTLRNEVEGQGTLFKELGQAWAEGGIGAVAALAKAKVKENIAWAIEEAAKAFGSLALGNPKAALEHGKSALQHTAAAAAWKVAGAVAGGSNGAGAGGGGGGSITNPTAGQNSQPPGPEVNIYLDGPGFDATNPTVQKVVWGAQQQARERYGENAQVRVIGRNGG